jgi:hypothetical protein
MYKHFTYRVFFKFHLIVGVEESIVNALYRLRITDQLFKSYVLHEWCVHNRHFNAYYEVKFKKHPVYLRVYLIQIIICMTREEMTQHCTLAIIKVAFYKQF